MSTEVVSVEIRSLAPAQVEDDLARLVALLKEAVDGGAGLGFAPPLIEAEGREYWRSLGPELRAGSRLLLGAYARGRLIGTGQLAFARLLGYREAGVIPGFSLGLAGERRDTVILYRELV